jgi:hypothetical protein
MDLMQVASAIIAGVKEFITTDGDDNKGPKSILGNAEALAKLGLRVVLATETRELPEEYRMDELFPKNPPSP